MSVLQPNSAYTTESPIPELERSRSTPGAPLSAVSIGIVTRVSTSSGASPGASVRMVTVGRLRSGSTSTGSRGTRTMPPATINNATSTTRARLRSEKAMMRSNMASVPHADHRGGEQRGSADHHHPLAGLECPAHRHPLAEPARDRHLARGEFLGRGVNEHQPAPVLLHHGDARQDQRGIS